jgi:hypothetical protein
MRGDAVVVTLHAYQVFERGEGFGSFFLATEYVQGEREMEMMEALWSKKIISP